MDQWQYGSKDFCSRTCLIFSSPPTAVTWRDPCLNRKMCPYLLSKFLRKNINFLLSESAVSPMNGKVQGPLGSPRFFMKKKVTRITATLVRNKMYDKIVSIVVTKLRFNEKTVLNFFFTSFQYGIALLLDLRDNNRGFMNYQSEFRLWKPR